MTNKPDTALTAEQERGIRAFDIGCDAERAAVVTMLSSEKNDALRANKPGKAFELSWIIAKIQNGDHHQGEAS